MKITDIAKIAHELNRAYCLSLGDDSQPSWEDAPEWQKNSIINGVNAHLNNPSLTPEQSHEIWLKQKTIEGWSYGPVKNVELKEHPCFLSYDKLPADMKVKDYNFKTIVNQLASFLSNDCKIADYEKQIEEISVKRKLFNERVFQIESYLGCLDITDSKKDVIKDKLARKYLKESNHLPELQELLDDNIDTKVRHITPADTNIFADLGFGPEESEEFLLDLKERIKQKALTTKE